LFAMQIVGDIARHAHRHRFRESGSQRVKPHCAASAAIKQQIHSRFKVSGLRATQKSIAEKCTSRNTKCSDT
jgi:hypothetical protein